MVYFLCQLDWAMGLADIWSNIILGVPERMFWMRLTFESVDLVKKTVLPGVSAPHPIS